jgi:hypothetical protein
MSLRELWLKKLEAEAVLSLLEKLDRIRAAPMQFDSYLQQHRIGAAVITVAQALDTMFSSDVAQVQALHKIMEQLMNRKQKAEEVVWELLMDVLFLRTGNGHAQVLAFGTAESFQNTLIPNSTASVKDTNTIVSSDSKLVPKIPPKELLLQQQPYQQHGGMTNPFLNRRMRFALQPDLQVEQQENEIKPESMMDSEEEQLEDDLFVDDEEVVATKRTDMAIPTTVIDAEFDLESEERRSLEERTFLQKETSPTYLDHVLGLRTLVECLVKLRRLDDVERILTEAMEKELNALVQREQARTYLRVEKVSTNLLGKKSGRYAMLLQKAGATTDLRDFRKHLAGVVSAFGNVYLRLMHLTQIVRNRVVSNVWRVCLF